MKYTWQLVGAYAVATATTFCGCATTSVSHAPTGLPTQQLHNVARPATPNKWLPKMLQPQPGKPKPAASQTSTLADTVSDSLPAKGKQSKPIDPLTMARLQERRGQTQQAVQLYEAELQKQPNNANIHHRLGVLAARTGQWDKADSHFRAATELDPNNSQLLCDCGYALYLQHQLVDAESCLRSAVALNPNNKAAHNNLGIVLGVQAKYDESLTAFRQGGSEAEAQANLGYVYMQLGDVDNAMAQLNHALSLDSKLRPAALALIQLNDLKQRLEPKVDGEAALIAQQVPTHDAQLTPDAGDGAPTSEQRAATSTVGEHAPTIEIAAAHTPPLAADRDAPAAHEATPDPAAHEPIDGSLTELRFRMAERRNDPTETPRPLTAELGTPLSQAGSRSRGGQQTRAAMTSDERRHTPTAVVQASAQLATGQTLSARMLTEVDPADEFPARVYKPSTHFQQVRTADRPPAVAEDRWAHSTRTLARMQEASAATEQQRSNNEALAGAVGQAHAANAAAAVVLPMPGDSPALVPQVRMPRPDEMLPAQSHMSQLPTHQLHPAASATWSAPRNTAAARSLPAAPQPMSPIRSTPAGN